MRNVRSILWVRLSTTLATLALSVTVPHGVWAQANLENPQNNSVQSGIGVISGWVCNAQTITLTADNAITVQAPYGSLRTDTQGACGDANNGFGFLLNWNNLGDGLHTVVAKADGVEFARATFTVVTPGTPYLQNVLGVETITLSNGDSRME